MIKRIFQILWIYIILNLGAINAIAQIVDAQVENTNVPMGEVFNLNISLEGNNINGQPDLSVLQKDFSVYNTSTSTQTSFINGISSQRKDWDIGLLPKKIGKLIIPSISVGPHKTNPIELTILPAGSVVPQNNNNNVKVSNDNDLATQTKFSADFSIENENPYIQQGVKGILTIYDAVGLQLSSAPQFSGENEWIVKMLEQPKIKQLEGNAREIQVPYILFPQKSGKLNLPIVTINGVYTSYEKSARKPKIQPINRGNLFQMLDIDFGNVFGVEKPFVITTKEKVVDVKPVPKEYGDNWWLPADEFMMISSWDKNAVFKIGEPVVREITMIGKGVVDAQLPEIKGADLNDVKTYPENPVYSSDVVNGNVVSQSVNRVVYIPQNGGKIKLPEIKIQWYDINDNKIKIALIPAETINVKGEIKKTEAQLEVDKKEKKSISKQEDIKVQHKQNNIQVMYIILSVISAFIFGIVLSYFIFRKKNEKEKEDASISLFDISGTLKNRDYRSLRDYLIKWGNDIIKGQNINNLNDLSEHIKDAEFSDQMNKLNSILYAGLSDNLDAEIIVLKLKEYQKNAKKNIKKEPLPKLYK